MPTKALVKKEETKLVPVSQEALAVLDGVFTNEGYAKKFLPRISFTSQDKTEESGVGKNKTITVVEAAGTFFTEVKTEDLTEDGKAVFAKEEIGDSVELHIVYERKQLRMYDAATEKFTSSPIYDHPSDIVPIFCDKQEVDRGTPAELQAKYMTKTTMKGKPKSALEEERVLYVIYKGVLYTMNIRGTSMYAFLSYKKSLNPAKLVTVINSEAKTSGQVSWNQMNFTALRPIIVEELQMVVEAVNSIRESVEEEKAFFGKSEQVPVQYAEAKSESDKEFSKW